MRFAYTVVVEAEDITTADIVMSERINHDEDLGFEYQVWIAGEGKVVPPDTIRIAQELCDLKPVELDDFRHEYPGFEIPARMTAQDAELSASRILGLYKVDDAIALIQNYRKEIR